MSRPRFAVWHLMLAVALAGLLAGGAEWVRRERAARLRVSWVPVRMRSHGVRDLHVNVDDIRAGIDPPRARYVSIWPDGTCRTEDAPPGTVRLGQFDDWPINPKSTRSRPHEPQPPRPSPADR